MHRPAYNNILSSQIRVRFLALLFIVGCVVVMYAVGWNSCASLRVALLGYVDQFVVIVKSLLLLDVSTHQPSTTHTGILPSM